MMRTLSWFYEARGWHQEGVITFQQAVAMPGGTSEMVTDPSTEDAITLGQGFQQMG